MLTDEDRVAILAAIERRTAELLAAGPEACRAYLEGLMPALAGE